MSRVDPLSAMKTMREKGKKKQKKAKRHRWLSVSRKPEKIIIDYYGQLWVLKKASLDPNCSTFPLYSRGEMCLLVLIDIESKESSLLTPAVMTEVPQKTIKPLVDVLQVEDNLGNRYFPINMLYTWDKDNVWLGHSYIFSVSKDAIQFFLVVPEKEKILLNLIPW